MVLTKEVIETLVANYSKIVDSFDEVESDTKYNIYFENKYGDTLLVVIFPKSDELLFITSLTYDDTFDSNDIKLLESINVTDWGINKHFIHFNTKVKDEPEFEDVIHKIISRYVPFR